MKPRRVLLADDQPIVIEGLKRILNFPEFQILGAVADGRSLVTRALELSPDLIIADVTLPLLNGIEATRQISNQCPPTKIIFLTMHREVAYATRAIRAGAKGYILKNVSPREIVAAVHQVLQNRTYVAPSLEEAVLESLRGRPYESTGVLTPRQREILQLLAEGKQPKEIAALLDISPRTVEFHKYRMMDRLALGNVAELIAWAAKNAAL